MPSKPPGKPPAKRRRSAGGGGAAAPSRGLTHIDAGGNARMVDVSSKPVSERVAIAHGRITMRAPTLHLIATGGASKGDVLGVARLAGIMAAKRTGDLIPLCHPLGLDAVEIALVDSLTAGDIAVFACDGPTERIAPWGELLSTAAQVRGAAGCVTDGLVRDVRAIRSMGFVCFHGGIGPLDSKGRGEMMAKDVPVVCGGVRVEPGDLVFGDVDGVVVLPQAVAGEALRLALEKVEGEDRTRQALLDGKSLQEVFEQYGIL